MSSVGMFFLLAFLATAQSFALNRGNLAHSFRGTGVALSVTTDYMEDGVTLRGLMNPQRDGIFLEYSIQKWLDEEYIPQAVHKLLGQEVRRVYVANRAEGITDLGEMMMMVGTRLEKLDMGEAFVGAWDVANKVSDLLMARLDRELCSCAGDLSKFFPEKESAVEEPAEKIIVVKEDIFSMKDRKANLQ